MPKLKKTANYFRSLERKADAVDAEKFSSALPEDVISYVVPWGDDKFLALVISTAERNKITDAINEQLSARWNVEYMGPIPLASDIGPLAVTEHSLAREGASRLGALVAAHEVYLEIIVRQSNSDS